MRLTRDELKALVAKPSGRNKYGAQRCEWNGIKFPSLAERRRFQQLFLLERSGRIANLAAHPKLPIIINGVKVCVVEADACYFEGGKRVFEDVKSRPTCTAVSNLKWKIVQAMYPNIEFRRVIS